MRWTYSQQLFVRSYETLLSPARWRVSGIPEQDVAGQHRGRGAEPHEAHGGQQDTGALDTSSSNSGGG